MEELRFLVERPDFKSGRGCQQSLVGSTPTLFRHPFLLLDVWSGRRWYRMADFSSPAADRSLPILFRAFEPVEATSLELIPLSVRYKLDQCAIKLHLRQWQQMPHAARDQLLRHACVSEAAVVAYRTLLTDLLQQYCDAAPDQVATPLSKSDALAWRDGRRWPELVVQRCAAQALPLPDVTAWQALDEATRHALCTVARSRHDPALFPAALAEFFPDTFFAAGS